MQTLESEAIEIIREAVAGAQRPAMLWAEGKESAVLLHLARSSFYPRPLPFPVFYLDYGQRNPELNRYRSDQIAEFGIRLLTPTPPLAESAAQTPCPSVQQIARAENLDLVICGLRHDEGRHAAVGQVFAAQDPAHPLTTPDLRPAPWGLYHTHRRTEEILEVFPLAHWTALDVWLYIESEGIPIAPLYLAAERWVRRSGDRWILIDPDRPRGVADRGEPRWVRVPSLAERPLIAVESRAETLESLIAELLEAPVTPESSQDPVTEIQGIQEDRA